MTAKAAQHTPGHCKFPLHTVGPWLADGLTVKRAAIETHNLGTVNRRLQADVCVCCWSGTEETEDVLDGGNGIPHTRQPGEAEAMANAALIVRAVNSHANLLAALQNLEAAATKFTVNCNCQTAGQDDALSSSLEIARAAIASATA